MERENIDNRDKKDIIAKLQDNLNKGSSDDVLKPLEEIIAARISEYIEIGFFLPFQRLKSLKYIT